MPNPITYFLIFLLDPQAEANSADCSFLPESRLPRLWALLLGPPSFPVLWYSPSLLISFYTPLLIYLIYSLEAAIIFLYTTGNPQSEHSPYITVSF